MRERTRGTCAGYRKIRCETKEILDRIVWIKKSRVNVVHTFLLIAISINDFLEFNFLSFF